MKDPLFSKKTKSDPNAPPPDRVPMPELKDNDKKEKVKALRELSKRVTLGPDALPSVCFYTLLNGCGGVTCCEVIIIINYFQFKHKMRSSVKEAEEV